MLIKHIYASWDAKDPNCAKIIEELRALPDKWLEGQKNHSERCSFASSAHKLHLRREEEFVSGYRDCSFGVFEYCFDSFESYKRDVAAAMKK
jgi:hypothetical protein